LFVENFALFHPGGAFLINKMLENYTVDVVKSDVLENMMVKGMLFEIASKLFKLIINLFSFWEHLFDSFLIVLHI